MNTMDENTSCLLVCSAVFSNGRIIAQRVIIVKGPLDGSLSLAIYQTTDYKD